MTEKNLQPATEQVESTVPETAPQSSDVADPAVSEKKPVSYTHLTLPTNYSV